LTLTVIGTSSSGKRFSSSAIRSAARALVSTIASLQNSMPVQAIVFCRQFDGRADSPMASSAVTSGSTCSGATPVSTIFWYGVRRAPATPYASMTSASATSLVPETRPAIGAMPT
jgi:hypothetical protein